MPLPLHRTFDELARVAEAEVERTLKKLPAPLRAAAGELPVTFESVPGPELVADGFDPDLLGLFVGPEFAESEAGGDVPSQIILFLESLWDYAEGSEAAFREEVRTTFLHELGHYLGLNEPDLEDRGLE